MPPRGWKRTDKPKQAPPKVETPPEADNAPALMRPVPREGMAPSLALNQGRLGTLAPLPPPGPPQTQPGPSVEATPAGVEAQAPPPKRKPSTHPLVVALRNYIGGDDAEEQAINILLRTADAARFNCSMPSDQVAALIRAQAEIEEEQRQ
jgi:hypothetical protein